jgi:hypothetical protein
VEMPEIPDVNRVFDEVKILFVSVYLPYEDDEDSRVDFGLQLSIVCDTTERNPGCMVYVATILMWTLIGIEFILRC